MPGSAPLGGGRAVGSNWEYTGGGPARKYYRITERGRADLVERYREWKIFVGAVQKVLGDDHAANG